MIRKSSLNIRSAVLTTTVLSLGLLCLIVTAAFFRKDTLPFRDSFATNDTSDWQPLGGTWEINGGAVYNRSDERGAKLVTGSEKWKDYQLSADLKLIGHEGDVGVIVRLGDAERGVDEYSGYYVGLRSDDSAIVIGRADHGWMEGRPVPMPGGVQIGVWYRLRIVVIGCKIGAEATNIATNESGWATFTDEPCFANGKIGLRSMSTGGAWRNVSVTPTSQLAWEQIRNHSGYIERPTFPDRESDYSKMRETYFNGSPLRSYRTAEEKPLAAMEKEDRSPLISSIESVRITDIKDEDVTIRGVITLASPLYVQDASGGIAVEVGTPTELNLGDEVEITGRRTVNDFTPKLIASNLRLLWDRTLVVPISVTSTQAASGAFDGSLVELSGVLRSKTKSPDQVITLQLYDSAQSFSSVVRGGFSSQAYESWEPGSTLDIRGICSLPSSSNEASFTISMRDPDDVQVLSGPPWWTGKQLIRLMILLLVLISCGVYLYLRLERWKMDAIIGERERLAHDMHDTLAQSFAGVGFHLQGLYNGVRSGNAEHSEVIAMIHGACDMVSHSHREASACIAALHPDADEGSDVLVALDHCTREMLDPSSRDEDALPLRFAREGVPRALSMPVRDALFHVGREAITNMLRHAQASDMELKLRYELKAVVLEICDNGVGFLYNSGSPGFGIRTMQRRCAKVGAQIDIVSRPGQGTRVTVRAPYGLRPRSIDWLRSFWNRMPHYGN